MILNRFFDHITSYSWRTFLDRRRRRDVINLKSEGVTKRRESKKVQKNTCINC